MYLYQMNKKKYSSLLMILTCLLYGACVKSQLIIFAEGETLIPSKRSEYVSSGISFSPGYQLFDSGLFLGLSSGYSYYRLRNGLSSDIQNFGMVPVNADIRFSLISGSFNQDYNGIYLFTKLGLGIITSNLVDTTEFVGGFNYEFGLAGSVNLGQRNVSLLFGGSLRNSLVDRYEQGDFENQISISGFVLKLGVLWKK